MTRKVRNSNKMLQYVKHLTNFNKLYKRIDPGFDSKPAAGVNKIFDQQDQRGRENERNAESQRNDDPIVMVIRQSVETKRCEKSRSG